MKIFRKYKTLWMASFVVVLAILFITNFSYFAEWFQYVLSAFTSLMGGVALAFILNLIMAPVEEKIRNCNVPFFAKRARTFAMCVAFLVAICIIALILSIVIPNLINAVQMLANEVPRYFKEIQTALDQLMVKYPEFSKWIGGVDLNWQKTTEAILAFILNGNSDKNVVNSTMSIVSGAIGSVVNLFVVVVFAAYILSEKERFIKAYFVLTDLFMPQEKRAHLTRSLMIIHESFKSFITGEIIEACILSMMCSIGMLILRLPYATMIGVLVGVINMIPMVGAFIGGGIGAFIIFTISPMKCLIFLVFLCVIQQIESNIFFPRVVGNKVGLPGIFVMMTIVVGGSLFGVLGMVLGVPLMASIYKIFNNYLAEVRLQKEAQKDQTKPENNKESELDLKSFSEDEIDPEDEIQRAFLKQYEKNNL